MSFCHSIIIVCEPLNFPMKHCNRLVWTFYFQNSFLYLHLCNYIIKIIILKFISMLHTKDPNWFKNHMKSFSLSYTHNHELLKKRNRLVPDILNSVSCSSVNFFAPWANNAAILRMSRKSANVFSHSWVCFALGSSHPGE